MNKRNFIKSFLVIALFSTICLFTSVCATTIGNSEINHPKNKAQDSLEIIVQRGHTASISSLAISPDGKYILSGSGDTSSERGDDTLKLWDVSTGWEIKTFRGHSRSITSAAFSSNGKYALSGSFDGTVKLWDIDSGHEIRTFSISGCTLSGTSIVIDCSVTAVAFSPDNKYILSGGTDSFLTLWDISSGRKKNTFKGHTKWITSVAFSPDGQYALSGSEEGTVKLWKISTTREIKTFINEDPNCRYSTRCFVSRASFSPDGKHVLHGNTNSLKLWDISSGKEIRTFHKGNSPFAFSPDGKYIVSQGAHKIISLWDISTGDEIRTFSGHSKAITSLVFSPDGRYIVSGSWDDPFKLWDIDTGHVIRSFNKGYSSSVSAITLNTDGKLLLAGGDDVSFKLWDIPNGRVIKMFKPTVQSIESLSFSSLGNYVLAETFFSGNNSLWDVASGNLIMKLNDDYAISPDEKLLIFAKRSTFSIYDISARKVIKTITDHSDFISALAFSPDSKYALSGSHDKTIKLWDVSTGREIRTFTGHSTRITSVAFSPDGVYALTTGSYGPTVKIWDISTGREIRTFKADSRVVFIPDSNNALFGGPMGPKKLIDISTGQELRALDELNAFSPDWKYYIVQPDSNDSFTLYNTFTNLEIRAFKIPLGQNRRINSIEITPDRKYIISGDVDNVLKIWSMSTGNEITRMISSMDGEWLIYTPDGYWDSSRNGGKLVSMLKGINLYSIDQFAVKNNRPDIILERIGYSSREMINHYRSLYKKRIRKIGVSEEQLSSELHVPTAKIVSAEKNGKIINLRLKLSDNKYDLKRYNIYVNDIPLFGSYGKSITGNNVNISEDIELNSGENKIEVSCFNEKGAESYRAVTTAQYDKEVKGDLYFIGFGVSDYKDKSLNLQYADKDAKDLSDIFAKMEGKNFSKVHIKNYLNDEVTIDNVKSAKEFLKNSKVDDTFVLFIAGHGIHDTDKEATYYYLPHNADVDNLSATAVNFEVIEDMLQGIPPRNKLFLMDTCESGEVEEAVQKNYYAMAETRGIKARTTRAIKSQSAKQKQAARTFLYENDRFINNDLLRRSGAIVFSSSKGGEFSYEDEKIENGFFTEEIINSLMSKKADKDGDGTVTTDELRDYVSKEVSKNSGGLQNPTVDRDNIYQKFGFPVVAK